MKATGALALAFLAVHLPRCVSWRRAAPHGGELSTILSNDLSSTWLGVPWMAIAYLSASGP